MFIKLVSYLYYRKMAEKCIICKEAIAEEYGKLKGTIVRIVDNKKTRFVYVCSQCQKEKDWLEKAKVKGA